ncbi:MAG: amidohydrolase family protein [Anaerolineae bacterium]|nr:amidohydrolase family protein [Anaerolineae bacterium]
MKLIGNNNNNTIFLKKIRFIFEILVFSIIYTHSAVPRYREVWKYAKTKENIFVDLSSSLYTNEKILLGVLETLSAEKCLYGTDGPYAGATQKRMLDRIVRLPCSDHEREKILANNFLELIRQ